MEEQRITKQEFKEHYYCYVDKAELVEDEIHFLFDGISKKWYDDFLNESQLAVEFYDKIIPQVIFAKIKYNQLKKNNPNYSLSNFQNIWVHLQLSELNTGFEAQLFVEDDTEDSEPIFLFIQQIVPLSKTTTNRLQTTFSLSHIPDATKSELNIALKHKSFGKPDNFVSAYNVGQGNLNAICEPSGIPIMYYDLGGGCYQNKRTYFTRVNLCFSIFKTVILSHWDSDHLSTAKRYYNTPQWLSFHDKTWVVPRQPLGASLFKTAMRIHSVSKLLIWPSSLVSLSFSDGEICLCNGPDKNHSGLAVITNFAKGANNLKKVLLPADAAYKYIPIPIPNLDGLIATHHGAEFDLNNAPVPPAGIAKAIAYSFGHLNTYHHPRVFAESAHLLAGWSNRKDTVSGHISFTTHVTPITVTCPGHLCSLSIQQSF